MSFDLYRNKNVLITGHTGFKGSWLTTWLQQLNANVTGISLEPNTKPSHFELLNHNVSSHFIDIRNYEKLCNVIHTAKPEIIFHLAAQPLVRDSYQDPLYTFETNIIGTANVLNACRNLDSLKAALIVTTDKCYDNKEWTWGYRESDPMGGHDPYSASKGCAELVTNSFRKSFFNLEDFGGEHQTLIASARAGNVIGGGDWSKDRLIPDIIIAATNNRIVKIRQPHATRPWQHVLESLSGYLCLGEKLLQGKKQFAEAWNFAPSDHETTTVLNVIHKMQSYWPKIQYEIDQNQQHPHEANLLKLDCSKANNILKWRSIWDLDATIKATIDWYRNFYEHKKITTIDNIKNYMKVREKNV